MHILQYCVTYEKYDMGRMYVFNGLYVSFLSDTIQNLMTVAFEEIYLRPFCAETRMFCDN